MLLLCKGCTCFCSDTLDVSLPPHLTQFNETNMAAVSGQCLTVTGTLVDEICETSNKRNKRDQDGRLKMLRNISTDFCGLPLYNILSPTERNSVQCARDNGCARVINRVQEIDAELRKMYCQFSDILERIDCGDTFSTTGDCDLCKVSHKHLIYLLLLV